MMCRVTIWSACRHRKGFHFEKILLAHRQAAGGSMTDDAAVARLAGMKVTAVAGDEANFKITVGEDLLPRRTNPGDTL